MLANQNPCNECALRLFNPKGHNVKGVGNSIFGNMIIVPYVDKFAYKFQDFSFEAMVKKMQDMLYSSTGEMLLDYCYVTPLIKCKQTERCIVDESIAKRCMTNLKEEFVKFNPTKILLLGQEVCDRFNFDIIDTNSVFIDIRNRFWFTNYHPNIGNHDPIKAQEFEKGLIKWFNAVKNNEFYGYNKI